MGNMYEDTNKYITAVDHTYLDLLKYEAIPLERDIKNIIQIENLQQNKEIYQKIIFYEMMKMFTINN